MRGSWLAFGLAAGLLAAAPARSQQKPEQPQVPTYTETTGSEYVLLPVQVFNKKGQFEDKPLGIEVAFAALPVAVALVRQIVFHWRKMACAGSARLDISRQIIDARRHPSLWLCKTWRSGCSSRATRPTLGQG